MKKISLAIFVLFANIIVLPLKSHAVPAAPTIHVLTQSDGSVFRARQWGDERSHGWETEDGYSIIFDRNTNNWKYAVHNIDGKPVISSLIAGKDKPPGNIPRHLRPSGNAREAILSTGIGTTSSAPQLAVPSAGTANIPVILINFSNTTTTYTSGNFNALLFGTGNYSMKDYYQEVSYGSFTVSGGPGGVIGWYNASNTHDYYGQNDGGGWDRWPGTLVREAVAAADAAFDFAPYDMDGDCYVDVIDIIHQGSGEEAGGPSTDIWSHSWSLTGAYSWGYSDGGVYTTNDVCPAGGYIKVDDYVIQPETLWDGQQTMGVFAHEYGHALGLPDLYDTDNSSEGAGNWSLMASGSWNLVTRPGDRPAHMDAWSKYFLGWVTPAEVFGTMTSEPVTQAATAADVYKMLAGSPLSGEYFLVENRQKTGFDAGLPGAGLLIWHIDGSKSDNNYECYPGGPSCATDHYRVKLVQADNLWNLEKNNNRGDSGDPYPGSAGNTSFSGSSSPDSYLYNGSPSNTSITNISAPASTMTATLATSVTCNDNDTDGYGNPGSSTCLNGSATDCNDNNPAVNPGSQEVCDNIDNDCDGILNNPECISYVEEDFNTGLPADWTITDNTASGAVWRFDDPGIRTNLTGGTGGFAIIDSDYAYLVSVDTELRTPVIDMTGLETVFLGFKTDFYVYSGSEVADVDVSVNGSSGPWTNVWRKTANYRGPKIEGVDISSLAAGNPSVMVRFHYYNAFYDWWWQVDDVSIHGISCMNMYFEDYDADGYGDPNNSVAACTQPSGYVTDNSDCDDSNPAINPETLWYQDYDGDGFGNYSVSMQQCAQPAGPPDYVLNDLDYDDSDNTTGPSLKLSGATPSYYRTLQTAYDAASDGASVLVIDRMFTEDLSIDLGKSIFFSGGYNGDFTSVIGKTTMKGDITITEGILNLGDFIMQPQ